MPMYGYKCDKCDSEAEYLVKVSDPIPPCKQCGSVEQTKQLSTGTGFCLMGYGWHKAGMSSKKVGNK